MTEPILSDPEKPAFGYPDEELIELFSEGELEVLGRMHNSSNATLLVEATLGDRTHLGIYKPAQGESPLRDFPDGIYKREVAVYRVASQLGWSIIPPTTVADGPFGVGSVQAFVNADFAHHYFSLMEEQIGVRELRQICTLDLAVNNTDRKSGHCLLAHDGGIYGIDNGLALHAQWKLRTVMWDFVGEPIDPADLADVVEFVAAGPNESVSELLTPFEVDALMTRSQAIIDLGEFPDDDTGGRRWPWPLV